MKAVNPEDKWTEGGVWKAYNHNTQEARGEFATVASAWNWIHQNFPEDANGASEHVTPEWFPKDLTD